MHVDFDVEIDLSGLDLEIQRIKRLYRNSMEEI